VIVCTPRPPELGGILPADFDALPPPNQPAPAAVIVVERERRVKRRLLRVAVQLGDNLFRRGRYREAQAQFEFALTLGPGRKELSIRLQRCRPQLPPPVVVAVAPPRPRIAVLTFVVNADPALSPPGFGDWAAQQVACQFGPTYEVVERGEVFWYMGRLGLTVRDVLTDAAARRWLARALNVRCFVFGVIQQTASFNVSTHLVDAESGVRQGTAQIHVKDHHELKLRVAELASQAIQPPAQRDRLQRQARENEKLISQARQLVKAGQTGLAVVWCQAGLKEQPGNVGMRTVLAQAEQQIQQAALEEKRQREFQARQAQLAAARQRQQQLAQEARAARASADKEAGARRAEARRALEVQRQRAHEQLLLQGQRALQQRHYQQAVQLLEGAEALQSTAPGRTALAQARAQAGAATRARAAEEKARQDRELLRQRAAELARGQARVAEERRRREAAAVTRRKDQQARDQAAYARLLDDGNRFLAQQKYDAALTALQGARRLLPSAEVERLIRQAQEKQASHAAEAARAAGEARRRAETGKKADQYQKWMSEGRRALVGKQYDAAVKAFGEARKIQPTDPEALRLLRNSEKARDEVNAALAAQARKREEDRQRAGAVQKLLAQGRSALSKRDLDGAARALDAAAGLAPTDPAVVKARQELQSARTAAAADAEKARRMAGYQEVLRAGRAALAARRYDDAVKAFTEAGRLLPNDPTAAALLQEAIKQRNAAQAAARSQQEDQRRLADFNRFLGQGQAALAGKRYEEAVKAFSEAVKLQPQNAPAAAALRQARQALDASRAAPPPRVVPPPPLQPKPNPVPRPQPVNVQGEYVKQMQLAAALEKQRKYAEAAQAYQKALQQLPHDPKATAALRLAEFNFHMNAGQQALAGRHFPEAAREFEAAVKLFPTNPAANAALKQARQGRP
jgi:tetratricopeptide (TPR) repeat protein